MKQESTKEQFQRRLKELRAAAGLSRQELAVRAGMSMGGVRDIEQGVNAPSWETVVKLATALGVTCEAFQDQPKPAKGKKEK